MLVQTTKKLRKHARQVLTTVRYSGGQRACHLCERRVRGFQPDGLDMPVLKEQHVIGGGYRADYACPFCLSSDRERLVYSYLQRETQLLQGGGRLLHIAAEKQLQRILCQVPGLQYMTADIERPRNQLRMDLVAIPCADNSFDAILCNHVLEHVSDDAIAMAELRRVLKPTGFAILQVPIAPDLTHTAEDPNLSSPAQREQAYGQADHVRLYGRDYPERLKAAGFQVECFSPTETYGSELVYKYGLLPQEVLYVCRKSVPLEVKNQKTQKAQHPVPK